MLSTMLPDIFHCYPFSGKLLCLSFPLITDKRVKFLVLSKKLLTDLSKIVKTSSLAIIEIFFVDIVLDKVTIITHTFLAKKHGIKSCRVKTYIFSWHVMRLDTSSKL